MRREVPGLHGEERTLRRVVYTHPGICHPTTYPGIHHPTTPWVHLPTLPDTTASSMPAPLIGVHSDGALGSVRRNSLGERREGSLGAQKCLSSYTTLRRVTPLSAVRSNNDRIDEGTSIEQGGLGHHSAHSPLLLLTLPCAESPLFFAQSSLFLKEPGYLSAQSSLPYSQRNPGTSLRRVLSSPQGIRVPLCAELSLSS